MLRRHVLHYRAGPLNWSDLIAALAEQGVNVPAECLAGLQRFRELVIETNAVTNLTRITAEPEFVEKHVFDGLLGLPHLQGETLVDVGTGLGVPGIPLALAQPGLRVVLVESIQKKAAFLSMALRALELTGAVHAERAEDVGRGPLREHADTAVIRAVGPLATCLELVLPLLRVGGRAVLYRGPDPSDAELEIARAVGPTLGGGAVDVHDHVLPGGAGRRLIVVAKESATPDKFPRRAGVPAKRPLT
ncbi:16S rRNA (guanine(527)-N(7))-methyltransferase RsmG [Planctomycetota bacterium]|nr:16S rRNA (guanine(527)-N(7))-methyltransferase RsmG [Planctomycetota bacterium]